MTVVQSRLYLQTLEIMPIYWKRFSRWAKADWSDLDAAEKVGVVSDFLYSLLKKVGVFLKKKASHPGQRYLQLPSRDTHLEMLLSYGSSAKQSQLTAAMFYKDSREKMSVTDPTLASSSANPGVELRYECARGTEEMAGPVYQQLLQLCFVDLKVILNRSRKQFCFRERYWLQSKSIDYWVSCVPPLCTNAHLHLLFFGGEFEVYSLFNYKQSE